MKEHHGWTQSKWNDHNVPETVQKLFRFIRHIILTYAKKDFLQGMALLRSKLIRYCMLLYCMSLHCMSLYCSFLDIKSNELSGMRPEYVCQKPCCTTTQNGRLRYKLAMFCNTLIPNDKLGDLLKILELWEQMKNE